MCVSVLIPVYNAQPYLQTAVESALAQPETGEIILVEDGSTDGSFALSCQLQAKFDKVKIFQHPNGENRGEAASRNLLLEKASCDYISFLDADDYFTPQRFKISFPILNSDPFLDAVYEGHSIFFENPVQQQKYLADTQPTERLLYLSHSVPPEELFRSIMMQANGAVGMPSFLIRRSSLAKLPRFNEALCTAPDAPFIFQMIALGRCVAGNLDSPVFMYRHHGRNLYAGTFEASPAKTRRVWLAWTRYFWDWGCSNLSHEQQNYMIVFFARNVWRSAPLPSLSQIKPKVIFFHVHRLIALLALGFYYKSMFLRRLYWVHLIKTFLRRA